MISETSLGGPTADGLSHMGAALFPRLASHIGSGRLTLEVKVFIALPVLTVLGSCVGFFLADWLIVDVLFGEEFAESVPVLQILLGVLSLEAANGFYARYLIASKQEATIPRVQAVGAALATLFSCVVVSLGYAYYAIRNRRRDNAMAAKFGTTALPDPSSATQGDKDGDQLLTLLGTQNQVL